MKLERKVGDFATAAVAVQLTLAAAATCEQVGIGLTNVGSAPITADAAPRRPCGASGPDEATIREAAQLAADAAQPAGGPPRLGRVQAGHGAGDDRPRARAERVARAQEARHEPMPTQDHGHRQRQRHEADVEPRLLLVHLLRDDFGLTGTHIGCDTSNCGACTVHVDGGSAKSCTMLAVQADGREIKTIEGWRRTATLHPLQQAFWDQHGLQCGFCTPGMIMQSAWLLEQNPDPTEDEIREGDLRATSAAAPATSTSSRRSSRRPTRCAPRKRRPSRRRRGDRDDRRTGHDHDLEVGGMGHSGQAQGRPALHPRQGRVHRRRQPARACSGWTSSAAPTPTPRSRASTPPRRSTIPGVARRHHRQGPREVQAPLDADPACRTRRWCCPSTRSCTRPRRWRRSSPPAATPPPTASAAVEVDYEPLPVVVDPFKALEAGRAGAPPRHEGQEGTTTSGTGSRATGPATDAALRRRRRHASSEDIYIPRIHVASIETCGCVADWDTVARAS